MMIHTLERPDSMPDLADWLERHLVSETLGELVAELKAVNDNHAEPALSDLLSLDSVLKDGLKAQPEDRIRALFRHPKRLLELQERIFIDGGEYWEHVPQSQELIDTSRRLFDKLHPLTKSPSQASAKSKRSKLFWISSLAALFLFGLSLGSFIPRANVSAAMAWTKPEAFRPATNRQEFLIRLAALAQDWFQEKPTTPEQLASRIIEFRRGCTQLQLHAQVIPEQDRKWLLEACRNWSNKLDQQLAQVEDLVAAKSGKSLDEIRTETDGLIHKLITRLESEAKA